MTDIHTLKRTGRVAQAATAKPREDEIVRDAVSHGAGLAFEVALPFIKLGYKAHRQGWNGRGMWVEIVTDWQAGQLTSEDRRLPWIMMRTADGAWVPWLISQTDALAHDWVVTTSAGEITEGAAPVGSTPLGNQ